MCDTSAATTSSEGKHWHAKDSTFVDRGQIWNMSGSSFIQSVGVMAVALCKLWLARQAYSVVFNGDRRPYLLSFLLHDFIKYRETVADELFTDDHCPSQHSGRGLDVSVSHSLVDQHPDVLHRQAAGQNWLKQSESENEEQKKYIFGP